MKKILGMTMLFSALIMGANSCNKEESLHEKSSGNSITLQLNGGVRTYAVPTNPDAPQSVGALNREKKINTAHVVLFEKADGGDYKYYGTFKGVPQGSDKYKFDVLKTGTFKMVTVVNSDSDLEGKIKGLQVGTSGVEDFGKLVASQTPGENNEASNFLMLSELSGEITTQESSPTSAGTINVKRAAARIDVINTVPDLLMTKLTFKHRVTNTRLAVQSGAEGLDIADKTYTSQEGVETKQCVATMYSYEYPTSGACKLIMEGSYKGEDIPPFEITIESDIKRNHIYNIIISPEGSQVAPGTDGLKLKADVIVKDWNEAELIEWNVDNLVGSGEILKYTVSGKHIDQGLIAINHILGIAPNPLENPKEVSLLDFNADTLKINVESTSVESNLVLGSGDPDELKIEAGEAKTENSKLVREFTVTFKKNLDKTKTYKFDITSGLDPSSRKEITVLRAGYKDHPKLPIEYVAEYNLKGHRTFATTHRNNESVTYQHIVASGAGLCPEGWHVPDSYEVDAIVPYSGGDANVVFHKAGKYEDISTEITFGEHIKWRYKSDVINKGDKKLSYALRMKSDYFSRFLCAYRYELVGTFEEGNLDSHLMITVRYLGPFFSGIVEDIAKEEFWAEDKEMDIVRIFPFAGANGVIGNAMEIWTRDWDGQRGWMTGLYPLGHGLNTYKKAPQAFAAIRPFSDK